jgi:hypothetical protein
MAFGWRGWECGRMMGARPRAGKKCQFLFIKQRQRVSQGDSGMSCIAATQVVRDASRPSWVNREAVMPCPRRQHTGMNIMPCRRMPNRSLTLSIFAWRLGGSLLGIGAPPRFIMPPLAPIPIPIGRPRIPAGPCGGRCGPPLVGGGDVAAWFRGGAAIPLAAGG